VNWTPLGTAESFVLANSVDPSDPDDPYDIRILSNGWIIVPADWGRVYRSKDGGVTWSYLEVDDWCGASGHFGLQLHLWMVDFFDGSLEGWMSGGFETNGGMLYHTLDGGDTWTTVTQLAPLGHTGPCSGPPPLINGVEVNPTQYGLAVLEPCTSDPAGGCIAVGYAGSHFAWRDGTTTDCVYDLCDGLVDQMKTSSGPYWEQVNPPPSALVQSEVPMFGAHSIKSGPDLVETWACSQLGLVRYSDDRGQTWTDQGSVDPNRLRSGSFYDNQNGLATGQARVIYKTTDGGVTLTPVWPTSGTPDGDLFAADVALSSSGVGVVVGERWITAGSSTTKSFDWAMRTTDFGQTWTEVTASLPPNGANLPDLKCCYAPPLSNDLYVAGANGYVAYSSDAGVTWQDRSTPGGATWNDVVFTGMVLGGGPEDRIGFAVGEFAGALAAATTSDNGQTWSAVPFGGGLSSGELHGVDCKADGSEAWAVGTQGLVLRRTTNRFVPQALGMTVTQTLFDVDYESGVVVTCGEEGRMLRRSAGVWTDQKVGCDSALFSVDMQNAAHGFVVGQRFFLAEYQ
jgi:photosystem II stability/assembly factor-like uncharacterized protein